VTWPESGFGTTSIAILVVADVTVVSPERAAPLEHAFVRIRDGRIAEVSVTPLEAPRTIDGAGRFLIPGLIDSHVHLEQLPMQVVHRDANPGIAHAALAQEPRSFLFHGFTTVIDLANGADRIDAWNRLDVRPDAWFCGAAPIANGYPMTFAPEAVRFDLVPYFLYDERQSGLIPPGIDPAEHTPERVIARMRDEGATCAKTYHETGFGPQRGLPTPELGTIGRLVAAARSEGMPVLIHANSLSAQQFALDSGVSIIAHGLWNGNAADDGNLSIEAVALLAEVSRRSVWYQPTMQVLPGEADLFDEEFLTNPRLLDVLPAALIDWVKTDDGAWFRNQVGEGLGDRDPGETYAPSLVRLDQVVAHLANAEARLLFGSDTPSSPTYANPPGLNGWWEIQRWARAGVSEAVLFDALTIANARAFGLESEVGSIEPGKRAHLLLVRQNPLQTVEAYDSIDTVFVGGVPYERSELSARSVR
jgi:imidazolonepropionase-like amidohydrolase